MQKVYPFWASDNPLRQKFVYFCKDQDCSALLMLCTYACACAIIVCTYWRMLARQSATLRWKQVLDGFEKPVRQRHRGSIPSTVWQQGLLRSSIWAHNPLGAHEEGGALQGRRLLVLRLIRFLTGLNLLRSALNTRPFWSNVCRNRK